MSVFVAIDFETADAKRDSACAVGLCRVEGGRIVYREALLIRPPRGMSPLNQAIHGLSYDDVKGAPTFAEVWAKVKPILAGAEFLAAHNASFDRSVLRACCCVANVEAPDLPWECTLELARQRWPKPASHSLPDVCRYLDVPFANHHEAGADAEACARVLIALLGPKPGLAANPHQGVERAPAWEPVGEVGAILDEIPTEFRTAAVLNLMRDAQPLGPVYALWLVKRVGAWFTSGRPGQRFCRCGSRCSLLCDLCARCIAELP